HTKPCTETAFLLRNNRQWKTEINFRSKLLLFGIVMVLGNLSQAKQRWIFIRTNQWFAFICQVLGHWQLTAVQFKSHVTLIWSIFTGNSVIGRPIQVKLCIQDMLSADSIILYSLTLKTCIFVFIIVGTAFCFATNITRITDYFIVIIILSTDFTILNTVTILQIITPVVHRIGIKGMSVVDFIIECQSCTSTDTLHIILTDIHIRHKDIIVFILLPYAFHIVGTKTVVIVRTTKHDAHLTVGKTVSVNQSSSIICFLTDRSITSCHGS